MRGRDRADAATAGEGDINARRHDLSAIATLIVLALIWGWPIVLRLTTAIPGTSSDRDVATMVWNVGWVIQATEQRQSLLASDHILVPFGADLRLHTYGLFPALLVTPLGWWLGAVVAFNVMLLATIALNGVSAYVLFRNLPATPVAALTAASALMLSGPILDQMRVGRPIFASIWVVCVALVLARLLIARPSLAAAMALGTAMAAALFTDLQIVLYAALWLAMFFGWILWQERRIDRARLVAVSIAAAIAAIPFIGVFYPVLAGSSAIGIAAPSPDEAVVYSYRWWDYLTPSVMPRAIGGYELAAAAVVGLVLARRDPRVRFWLAASAAFLVLALGPTLKFTGIPLPFALLSVWGPLEQFRTPARLTIPAVIGLAAVAALALDILLRRARPRTVVLTLLGALILRAGLASTQHPLRVQEFPRYDLYRRLALENSMAAVIEVPFGVRSGLDQIGGGGEVLQYYQHLHRRPVLNAMVARLPEGVFAYYRARPSLMLLAGEPIAVSDEVLRRDFDEVLEVTRADVVLVHRDLMTDELVRRVERFLEQNSRLTRIGVEGNLVVYRAASRP